MSHCLPDWDGLGGELEAILATADFDLRVTCKGKGGSLLQKQALASDFALVGDPDAILSPWSEQMIATQPAQPGGTKPAHWQANCPNEDWSGEPQPVRDAITPSKPPVNYMSPSVVKESCLAVDVPIVDTAMNTSSHQEDEMVSWLQYPTDESQYKLDETLESAYCSDFFGELPHTNLSTVQSLKDSFAMVGQQSTAGPRPGRNSPATIPGSSNVGSLSRVASADAAMALGAGRAAGLLPQAGGVEAFTKVRTTMQQPKLGFNSSSSPPGKNAASMCAPPGAKATVADSSVPSPMLPLKGQPTGPSEQYEKTRRMNFPHFSRPAVQARASLQSLGVSQQPASVARPPKGSPLVRSTWHFDASRSSASSIAESTTTRQQPSSVSGKDAGVPEKDAEGQQQSGGGGDESPWLSTAPNCLPKDNDAPATSIVDHVECGGGGGGGGGGHVANGDRCSPGEDGKDNEAPGVAGQRAASHAAPELQEPPEATITSSSGGSGNSSCRGKGVSSSSGQKRPREEETECQSDDAEEEQVELKKPARTGTAKRTRAAEVHNMSERRRRDRINEKMKALQELIPNSNKSDKASMLDEAIAYLKMLQVQIADISVKSGLSIPNMIPAGMQHLQMPQMLPSMGIRMGIGPMMGVGMGMMDMNCMNATGRPSHPMSHPYHHGGPPTHAASHLMPHPAQHGGPSYSVSQMLPHPSSAVGLSQSMPATPPAVSLIDSHNLRVPSNNSALESVYLSRQHPLHLSPHPQAMDVYGAYMLHQQQHQQLLHFPNNVNGVSPHQLPNNNMISGTMCQSPSTVGVSGASHLLPNNVGGGLHPSSSNMSGGGSQ